MAKDSDDGNRQDFTVVPFKPKNGGNHVKEMLEYLISINEDMENLVVCSRINDHDGDGTYLMTAWTSDNLADVALAALKIQESIWSHNGEE